MKLMGTALAVLAIGSALAAAALAATRARGGAGDAGPVRLITLDPGHFHAALIHAEMYPGVSPTVHVFGPLGPDLLAHLERIARFNTRADQPTHWQLEVHAGPDPLPRMLEARPGNAVVISGRNRGKIDAILASLRAGLNVLADKPWILEPGDLPKLEAALATAEDQGLVAYDMMTERFEITSILQRELVQDPAVFGSPSAGTPERPGAYMESVHHLMKTVAGAPNIRPTWFFDTGEQGEGLNDIGTHLVDLAQWTLFPDQAIDRERDLRVLSAYRWPTRISETDFRRVTGSAGFPAALRSRVRDARLEYFCNTHVSYALRGIHVGLSVIWDWEAPAGSADRHFAYYQGSRSRVEVRQSEADAFQPELFVVPEDPSQRSQLRDAVNARIAALSAAHPGLGVEDRGDEIHVVIPPALRVGHEAHFAQVARQFLSYLEDPGRLPVFERPNMLAKYSVTTLGTELSRSTPIRVAPRRAP
jgi:predicted dehydrogenase